MAKLRLPVESDPPKPLYTIRYTLDGEEWIFRFDWNARAEHWVIDIGRAVDGGSDEVAWSARGIVLVCEYDMLWRWRGRIDMPRGALLCLVNGDDRTPPRLNDFGNGNRVELWYVEPG